VGLVGDDGEGYELSRALESLAGVRLSHFLRNLFCLPTGA
jgi:hypothetical protein